MNQKTLFILREEVKDVKKKKRKGLIAVILCLSIIASGFGSVDTQQLQKTYMQETIETIGEYIDGEEMFDYLSYIYLGWRTTGGRWQNQVIDTFIVDQLEQAGYTGAGAGETVSTAKSANDMSSATDDDYVWVTYFNDIDTLTWDPEYAKLEVTAAGDFEGKDQLIERINVESFAFNPTTDTYLSHYGMDSIDDMWEWITEKDADGNRINVLNGEEAELNKRVHLAWNSCFTEEAGTDPADAVGVTGEVVYIGTTNGTTWSEGYTAAELEGKVLLSDSSLRNTFTLAQNVGAVAVASKASLDDVNTPKDEDGNIIEPFYQSARYASGATLATTAAQTATGNPIVEWQLSNDQYDALIELLEKSDDPVVINSVSIGTTYAMNDNDYGSKGQAIAIAEIKGSTNPEERIFLCAHVQEPSSNDNATGAATLLGIATAMKRMIDDGVLERPERTITFMWGDEMEMATCYMNSHTEEKENIVAVLDLDMTGEDPDKTGGVMRIEKTPDPSAIYNYTLDELPWEDGSYYDETFKNSDGEFVRLPDSHTLWGAGSISGLFQDGFYLNDLYMYAAQSVISYHDSTFRVEVCPYEGGSDHSRFLAQGIPALLTWHFSDYTYHTSVDTLNMSSAAEMENVGITSLGAALMMANATDENEEVAIELLTEVRNAALERFDTEQQNTLNHQIYVEGNSGDYATALVDEIEVLGAWHDWYQEALLSIEDSLLENPSEEYIALRTQYQLELEERYDQALRFAEEMIRENPGHTDLIHVPAVEATPEADGNMEYWYCGYCGKYYADEACTQEILIDDTVVKYVPEEEKSETSTDGQDYEDPDRDDESIESITSSDTPKTGDTNDLLVFIAIGAASAAAAVTTVIIWRKQNRQEG